MTKKTKPNFEQKNKESAAKINNNGLEIAQEHDIKELNNNKQKQQKNKK